MAPHTPWQWIRTCLGLSDPVNRATYAVCGVVLAVLKYAVEAAVLWRVAGRQLSPLQFISPSFLVRSQVLEGAPQWLAWAWFLWSVPFIWIALSMSVRRAAAAGVSPWVGATVLLPLVNLVTMTVLACLPDRSPATASAAPPAAMPTAGPIGTVDDMGVLRAIVAALAVGVITFQVGVYGFQTYGAVLFFATPLVMGMVAGFFANRPVVRTTKATMRIGMLVMVLAGGVLLAFAFEGLICLVMAAPIVMPLSVAGALLGKWIAEATPSGPAHALPVILSLPLLAGAESLTRTLPEYEVLTVVDVAAPPEVVWRHVVAFPDLPEPEEWFFRCGIACPQRARIEGTGVGAVRHCEFSTGDFVEPITAWEEPRRLAFDVIDQPDPMVELSPWRHVHPPHLHDRSLQSRRGEFRLVPAAGGGTRLEGRTWYTFDMHPQAYWTMWSDYAIHAIHRRVLEHVKRLAEADTP
jgi:uncharacterized protein YndB with AHSA1/START domain